MPYALLIILRIYTHSYYTCFYRYCQVHTALQDMFHHSVTAFTLFALFPSYKRSPELFVPDSYISIILFLHVVLLLSGRIYLLCRHPQGHTLSSFRLLCRCQVCRGYMKKWTIQVLLLCAGQAPLS